jgi:WD40 repeat protein
MEVLVWDVKTGRILHHLKGHDGPVNCVVFTPDGRHVLSGGVDKSIRIWDSETGKEIKRFQAHFFQVWSLAVSPNGDRVVSGGTWQTPRLWDMKNARLVLSFTLPGGDQAEKLHDANVVFNHDGSRVLAAGGPDGKIRLWNAHDGRMLLELEGHKGGTSSVAISADDRYALSGGFDNTVRYWDLSNGKQVAHFDHKSWVWTVGFFPSGRFAVSGGIDGIRLWRLPKPEAPGVP